MVNVSTLPQKRKQMFLKKRGQTHTSLSLQIYVLHVINFFLFKKIQDKLSLEFYLNNSRKNSLSTLVTMVQDD